jgi:hypothetical protein
MITPQFTLSAFQGYADDGAEGSATTKGAVNADWTQDWDENFRARIVVQESAGGAANNVTLQWQYRKNGGTWTNITTTTSNVKAVSSSYFSNLDDTTQQIGSGTFITDNDGFCDTGSCGGTADFLGNDELETEINLQIVSTDVSDGDTIELRVEAGTGYTHTDTQIPSITVNGPSTPVTVTPTGVQANGAVGTATVGVFITTIVTGLLATASVDDDKVYTRSLDGHLGIVDIDTVWTDDSNLADGSTSTYATASVTGTTTTNHLTVKGIEGTDPGLGSDDSKLRLLRWRIYAYSTGTPPTEVTWQWRRGVSSLYYTGSTGFHDNPAWSSWNSPNLSNFTNGWDSIQPLELRIWGEDNSGTLTEVRGYTGEVEITVIGGVTVIEGQGETVEVTPAAVTDYYFDSSTSDPDSAWTNEANAIDGLTTTYAETTSLGAVSTNELQINDNSSPASGGPISQVRGRMYSAIDATSGGLSTLFVLPDRTNQGATNFGTVPDWSSYVTFSGDWTWADVNVINAFTYVGDIGQTLTYARLYKVELEVTTTGGLSATGEVGTVTVSITPSGGVDVPVTGVEGKGHVGSAAIDAKANVSATGVEGKGAVGTVIASATVNVPVTGVEATGGLVYEDWYQTYYADDQSPVDADAVWTDDVDAFDGVLGTGATCSTVGSLTTNRLASQGTTNGASGGPEFEQVEIRAYGSSSVGGEINAAQYWYDAVELGGTATLNSDTPQWTNWVTLTPPSVGWTWGLVRETQFAFYVGSGSGQIDKVEERVKVYPVLADANIDITGSEGEGAVGSVTVTTAGNVDVTGIEAKGHVGTVTVTTAGNVDVPVTGVEGTGAVGTATVVAAANASLTGVQGTGAVGTAAVDAEAAVSVTGVEGDGEVGAAAVDAKANTLVVGVEGTGEVGSVATEGVGNVLVTGLAATGEVGAVSVTAGGAVSVPVTGIEATGEVGSVTVVAVSSIDVPVTGVEGTGEVGSITVTAEALVTATGIEAAGYVGAASVSGDAVIAVSGQEAAGATNTVTVDAQATTLLTGQDATGEVGSVSIEGGITASVTGVSATGAVGSVTIGLSDTKVLVSGVEAAGLVGVVNVIDRHVPTQDPNYVEILPGNDPNLSDETPSQNPNYTQITKTNSGNWGDGSIVN